MQHTSSHPLGCLTPSLWVSPPINFLPYADKDTRYLISGPGVTFLDAAKQSQPLPLQGVQHPALWSDVPALTPEGGATCDSEPEGASSTIGGGAVLLLPPPGVHSLSFPFSCRHKTLASCHLSIATDISHCDIALDFSQASLNIIFKFN